VWIEILFFAADDGGGKLLKIWCRLDIPKFVFSNRMADNWNSVSDNCVSCIKLNNFKSHIRLHWDWKPQIVP